MEYKDNLLGVIETVFKWKKFIIVTSVATAIGAAVISLLLPVYYESTTIFYAASPDLASPEALFGTSNESPDYYGTENDIDRLLSIAKSGELATFMIDSFNLYERYDIKKDSRLGAYYVRLEFDEHFDVTKTKYDAIELSIEDKDKDVAARMTNAAREHINFLAQKLIKESQFKTIRTYETNIRQKEREMAALNDTLQKVRVAFGVYNTEEQAASLSELIAEAEAKLNNANAKVETLQAVKFNRDSINLLKANIRGYENEVTKLQERLEKFNQGMALVDVLTRVQEDASGQLAEDKERYKQTKASYTTDFPATLLLEEAPIPVVKSRPKRALIVVAATAVAFIFSVIGVIIFDTYKDVNWREVLHLR
jgi:capsule polysaccharide export protein KpsE/RkpR